MRREAPGIQSTRRLTLCAMLTILMAITAADAVAQPDDRHLDDHGSVRKDSVWLPVMGGDTLWVDSSMVDSILEADTLAMEETRKGAALSQVPPGFHPRYAFTFNRQRSTTALAHNFSLSYLVNRNIVVSDTVNFKTNRSDGASRETNEREDKVGFQYLVRKGVRFDVSASREKDNDRSLIAIDDKETISKRISFGTTLRAPLPGDFALNMVARGILSRRGKDDERESAGGEGDIVFRNEVRTGISQRYIVRLLYDVDKDINGSLDATIGRGNREIVVKRDGEVIQSDRDNRDDLDRIKAGFVYKRLALMKLDFGSSAEKAEKTFARAEGGVETTTDRNSRASVTARGDINKRLDYKASVRWSSAEKAYAIDIDQTQRRVDVSADMLVNYAMPWKLKTKLQFRRSKLEEVWVFQPDRTGDTHRGEINLNLSRKFWKSTNVQASGLLSLSSRLNEDVVQDKDDTTKRLSMSIDNKSSKKISGKATISVDQAETINIHTTRSNRNQTRETWTVNPSFDYSPIKRFSIRNAYNLRLVYTFKSFNSAKNTMSRISELRSNMRWKLSKPTVLTMTYKFKVDQNGRFRGSGITRTFLQEGETSTQRISLQMRYTPIEGLDFRAEQFYETTKRYSIEGEKTLEDHNDRVQISNSIEYKTKLPRDASFNFFAKQIQDATLPIFRLVGNAGRETRKTQWNMITSFSIAF